MNNYRYWTTYLTDGRWGGKDRAPFLPVACCVVCRTAIRPIWEGPGRGYGAGEAIGGWSHVDPEPTLCIDPHPYAVGDRDMAEPRTYYVGSYAYRHSDPMGSFLATSARAVEAAIDAAVEWEMSEMPGYCLHPEPSYPPCDDSACYCGQSDGLCDPDECPDCDGGECSLCHPDLVTFGVWPETARELGLTLRWWNENRRSIVQGEAVSYGEGD